MTRAVYPGSFDPITLGHLDIVERSSQFFDHLIVGVLYNRNKTPLFTVEERVKMIEKTTEHLPNVEVRSFEGLLVDFVNQCDAQVIVRGLRVITDYDYEMQMAQTNRVMAPNLDTVFFATSLEYSYLSSTTAKEVALFGGDLTPFLPPHVIEKIKVKFGT